MERYDVVVVGVGAMGSAALYHLARRGKRALGIERFDVPHERGSSHGLTRIIRLAYFEHPGYVPLVQRAYELWRELEQEAGEQLLHVTGIVEGGERILEGALRSCEEHAIPHEVLDGRELARRFPAYRLPPGMAVVYQADGGFLASERCLIAHVTGALARGAVVRAREQVLEWRETEAGIRVRTDRGEVVAESLVLTAGAWSQEVARLPEGTVRGVRQVFAWMTPFRRELFTPARFPVFNLVLDGEHFYGFPAHGLPALKLGRYDHDAPGGHPDALDREPTLADEAPLRTFAERYLPEGAGPTLALRTCLFEPSPDEHFLIDRHPESEHAVVAAGFSGHGFKFASVVGEILADLVLEGATRHDLSLFRLGRFA
ncbi:MAG: N-methyl-L-tryptophan oxidase [Thermoleophilia bacterium]|nr:N-methyl-L-tryptophan oxidase [Gaiellaceae bacterium]MDW8338939.1 N-methyl-L-tryptophan oxidase [Thermoleophilia bacterium]